MRKEIEGFAMAINKETANVKPLTSSLKKAPAGNTKTCKKNSSCPRLNTRTIKGMATILPHSRN